MTARRRPVALLLGALAGVMALLLTLIVVGGLVVASNIDDALGPRGSGGDGLVPAQVEPDTPAPQPAPLPAGTDLAVWSERVAAAHELPGRVVRAYGAAELAQRALTPDCRLSWVTLAGIGRVESQHGRISSAEIGPDGVARPAIIGIPLDGSNGTKEITDTDAGRLDGDTALDRAVGPMQFLPTTWAQFGADGDGDGVRDPQQIDDATLAAAGYLCADGRDTASGAGWWAGVMTYNASTDYARLVWAAAARYTEPATP